MEEEGTLIHGDLHAGNVLCETEGERIRCVGLLDLETAFAGPPEADLANAEVLHGPLFTQPLPEPWFEHLRAGYGDSLDPLVLAFFRIYHLANMGFYSAFIGDAWHAETVARGAQLEWEALQTMCAGVRLLLPSRAAAQLWLWKRGMLQQRAERSGGARALRPVLYLDIDDTLLSWSEGRPRAAPGAREFLLWALENHEVRWLTKWCPNGEMRDALRGDLCKMIGIQPEKLESIRGFDWEASDSKLNGIAWLEHVVLGRSWVWVEDEQGVGERELRFLAAHGFRENYHYCNVTKDPQALVRLHEQLRRASPRASAA